LIIKLLEQPIIAIHEAEIAGTVDGVIIKNNKVSCIYHRNMENHFAIPVENTIIGSDAVMIQDMTAMTFTSQSSKSLKSLLDVYSISGRHLGCLHGIEVDDELVVRYIYADDYKIEMSKIVSYESVIIADMEEAELENMDAEACSVEEGSAAEEETAISMEIEPEIKWNDENGHEEEKDPESSELSVVRATHQTEAVEDVPDVDAKYAYLCGKQLLEGIDIEDVFYEKGTVISPDIIKHAIANNAIVKVIVNAEE